VSQTASILSGILTALLQGFAPRSSAEAASVLTPRALRPAKHPSGQGRGSRGSPLRDPTQRSTRCPTEAILSPSPRFTA